jgi:hypothetical protein
LLIFAALEKRIVAQREAERANKQLAAFDEARERHDANWRRVKEFLDRICAEVRQVMGAYPDSEMKIAPANCDLPVGALPVDAGQNEQRSETGLASRRTLRGEVYCAPWSASTSRPRSGIREPTVTIICAPCGRRDATARERKSVIATMAY